MIDGPYTKSQARKRLADLGYSRHYDTGSSGDYGYGSREYYSKPDPELNSFGQPLEHATISKLPDGWYTSVFGS